MAQTNQLVVLIGKKTNLKWQKEEEEEEKEKQVQRFSRLYCFAYIEEKEKKVCLVDLRHLFSVSYSLGCKNLSSFLDINTNNKKK